MHLTPEMWRMLPVFWVLGLLGVGCGLPLWLCRVKPNPYYGLTIGEQGGRDDIWYPVNLTLGKNLTGMGARTLIISTAFAFVDWRQPWHYLFVAGSFLLAEAMVFGASWRMIGKAVQAAQDEEAAKR